MKEQTDVGLVLEVETYREKHDFCSDEEACKALGIDINEFFCARRRIEVEIEKIRNDEKAKKEKEKENKKRYDQMMEILRIWIEEEREQEQIKEYDIE